ncbi:MAG: hypothetical protein ACXU8U_07975 [Asticcacaulis sp.]
MAKTRGNEEDRPLRTIHSVAAVQECTEAPAGRMAMPRRELHYKKVSAQSGDKGAESQGTVVRRYINLIAYWPVLVTLYLLSAGFGVWTYFDRYNENSFFLFAPDDYVQAALIGGVYVLLSALLFSGLFAAGALLFLPFYLAGLCVSNLISNIGQRLRRRKTSLFFRLLRNFSARGFLAVSTLIWSVIFVLCYWESIYDKSSSLYKYGQSNEDFMDFTVHTHSLEYLCIAVIAVFGIAAVMHVFKPLRRFYILMPVAIIAVLPTFGAQYFMDHFSTRTGEINLSGKDVCKTLDAVKPDMFNGKPVPADYVISRDESVVWNGSKASIVQCRYSDASKTHKEGYIERVVIYNHDMIMHTFTHSN